MVRITVTSINGATLVSMDLPAHTKANDLKGHIANRLGLSSFSFVLLNGDEKFEGPRELEQISPDGSLGLTLIKLTVPKVDSSGIASLQEDAKPTYKGLVGSAPAGFFAFGRLISFFLFVWIFLGAAWWSPILIYMVYICEALLGNSTARGLRNLCDGDSVANYIQQVKELKPSLKVEAKCYHHETRTVIDKDGRKDTERVEVVSDTITEHLRYARWNDESGELKAGVEFFPLLQVHFRVKCEPGDDPTSQDHDRQRKNLIDRARARDEEHEITESIELIESSGRLHQLREDMISTTSSDKPAWLGWNQYVVATLLGGSWLYRLLINRNSIKGDFTFKKAVYSSLASSS